MNFWRRPSDSSTRFCVLIQERPLRSDITETAIFPAERDDVVDVLEQQHGFCNAEIELLKITVLDFVCDSSVRLRAFDDSHILREYLLGARPTNSQNSTSVMTWSASPIYPRLEEVVHERENRPCCA